jgi:lactoylglutathione lyase
MTEVASIVLFSERVEENVAFYRALGAVLEDEEHGDGIPHAAGDVGGIHVAVLPAAAPGGGTGWRDAGSTFVGFWVTSLEGTLQSLQGLGVPILRGHEQCEWGCRVVVEDFDRRAVEVNQQDHCSTPTE